MKKIILIFFISLSIMSFKKNEVINYDGRFTDLQLKFVQENYNWSSDNLLIINFRYPQKNCDYDIYKNLSYSENWWKGFYSKIDLKNSSNIFVYSDSEAAKYTIDSITHFEDKYNYFLNTIFTDAFNCYGLLVINKLGYYVKVNGEYSQYDVSSAIENLKKIK